jgi:hypothetical protein
MHNINLCYGPVFVNPREWMNLLFAPAISAIRQADRMMHLAGWVQ